MLADVNFPARARVGWIAVLMVIASCTGQSETPSPTTEQTRAASPSSSPSIEATPSPSPALAIDEIVGHGSSIASVEWLADQASLEGAFLNDVVRFGSLLVAVGNDGGASGEPRYAATWTSADGRTWESAQVDGADASPFPTMVGLPGNGGALRVATDGQQLVAVGGVGNDGYGPTMTAAVWISTDGLSWEPATSDASFDGSFMLDVTAFAGGWIAVGVHEGDVQTGVVWSSTDGRDWSQVDVDLPGAGAVVASLESTVVLLARDPDPYCGNCFGGGTHVFTSDGGRSWTETPADDLPADFGALDLVRVGDGLVTVSASQMGNNAPIGNVMWETTDGLEWREVLPYPAGMNGGVASLAAMSDGPFLAGSLVVECCAYPALWQLTNGDTWEAVLPDRQITEGSVNMSASTVAPDGSIVAVGSYEAQSPDGISCCVIRGVIAIATPASS